jgi:type IV secretory pathway TrbL component
MLSLLIQIVIGLVIVGVILWALTQFPIDETIARLIRVVVVVFAVIYLLYVLTGLLGHGHFILLR